MLYDLYEIILVDSTNQRRVTKAFQAKAAADARRGQ